MATVSSGRSRWGRGSTVAAALLVAGCAAVPAETPETIAAREPVLLAGKAMFGSIVTGRSSVAWEDRGSVLMTPTTLYFTSSGSRALSYVIISDATVRDLPDAFPLLPGSRRDNLLVVQARRPLCGDGCVFRFLDDDQASVRAVDIIEAQRPQLDPFGRSDGARPVWLAAGMRNARGVWAPAPEHLNAQAPADKQAFDRWLCERTDCRGVGRTAQLYGGALRQALSAGADGDYRFRTLEGVTVNRRTELDTSSMARALRAADPAVDSLLVSDLYGISLREAVGADGEVSIVLTFRAFVDFFDIRPLKDGDYFWAEHLVARPLQDWLAMDDAAFASMLREVAHDVACQVLTRLAEHGGAIPGACPPRG